MLEKLDLSKKIAKDVYNEKMAELRLRLGELQRQAKDQELPVVIVFEGWSASGKGRLINELLQALDPRGFSVFAMDEPTLEEKARPFLRRYWVRLPADGRIAIFDRSWYRAVLTDRVVDEGNRHHWQQGYQQINSFEKQIADHGTLVLKFFLHISKGEQKKRFKNMGKNDANLWRLHESDHWQHAHYDELGVAIEEMLEKTDFSHAPWTLVEAEDQRFAALKIYNQVVGALEAALQKPRRQAVVLEPAERVDAAVMHDLDSSILDKADLSLQVSAAEYKKRTNALQEELRMLQYSLFAKHVPTVIVFEGWDAAGKGGCIRRLTQKLDPRGYGVVPIGAPNDLERRHHYLWRFWREFPRAGEIAIFDRSWYGRVLVERVEGFCQQEEWKRAYHEINEMEEQLALAGGVLIKFWLHIDQEEQLQRFQERQDNSNKQWKITPEDWRNREKWQAYRQAVDEMLFRTSTVKAPWTLVEANSKNYARLKVLETVVAALRNH